MRNEVVLLVDDGAELDEKFETAGQRRSYFTKVD